MRTGSNITKYLILSTFGVLLCTLPPLCAILSFFPIWTEKGGRCIVSGFVLLLLAAAFAPLYRSFKRLLESAAAYTLWLVVFVLFFILSSIADEMTVISFFGFLGNVMGAIFFKLAEKYKEKGE